MRTTDIITFASALLLASGCASHHPYGTTTTYSYGTPSYTASSTTHGAEVISSPSYSSSTTTLPVPTTQTLSDRDNALVSEINTELTRNRAVGPFAPNVHVYAQNGA